MNFVYMLRFLTNVTELENEAHVYQIPSEAGAPQSPMEQLSPRPVSRQPVRGIRERWT